MGSIQRCAELTLQMWFQSLIFKANQSHGFGGLDGKESACSAEDLHLIPGSGKSIEERGYPLQYSCLENSMDRRAWWATVHEVAKIWT